jgi:hypothetical protein
MIMAMLIIITFRNSSKPMEEDDPPLQADENEIKGYTKIKTW